MKIGDWILRELDYSHGEKFTCLIVSMSLGKICNSRYEKMLLLGAPCYHLNSNWDVYKKMFNSEWHPLPSVFYQQFKPYRAFVSSYTYKIVDAPFEI